MTKVNLNELELNEFVGQEDKNQHCKATFPLLGAHGSKDIATVYFEIEPGDSLGQHTDSAEEILLVLQGNAKVIVGEEEGTLSQNEIALVPKMVPHNLINIGNEKLRVLGMFGAANNIVATFEQAWEPGMNSVNTAEIFESVS